jgi:outer membrane protein assembly factor BamB
VPLEQRRRITLAALAAFTVIGVVAALVLDASGDDSGGGDGAQAAVDAGRGGDPDPTDGDGEGDEDDADGDADSDADSDRFSSDYDGWVDPASFGHPYPNAALDGLLTFRGNPTRSYYGRGPVPKTQPRVLLRFPDSPMCRQSVNLGETKVWCGMGWTGQPLVFDRDGRRWVVFGGYDGNVHFMDAETGERILGDVQTDDLIKGTPTIDPDGAPLVYVGSRDNYFRIIAIDRPEATVLWKMHANDVSPVKWNDDFDSSPVVLGDFLFVGGENSQFYAIKLNRARGDDGLVTVDPQVVWHTPAWDDELLGALRGFDKPEAVSVESSPTVVGNTLYFANSGGLVLGYDLSPLEDGQPPERTFRYWTGDDTDASVVADEDGYLYVASEYERGTPKSQESGQLMKLDPRKSGPLVWKVDDQATRPGGIWGTPAVTADAVYVATNGGRVLGVDRTSGAVLWEKRVPGPTWASPVVVDDVLLLGDCAGVVHAWDVSDTKADPPELWSIELGGCIEATPAVWEGRIYLGSRNGHLYVLG